MKWIEHCCEKEEEMELKMNMRKERDIEVTWPVFFLISNDLFPFLFRIISMELRPLAIYFGVS